MPFSLCIAIHRKLAISETFIRDHAERLPGRVTLLYGEQAQQDGVAAGRDSLLGRIYRNGKVVLGNRGVRAAVTANYLKAFRKLETEVVLAEYGLAGILVMEACRRAGIPLVVHFHGYDASDRSVLNRYGENYRVLFENCASIVVPSRAMKEQLFSLGAPLKKIHCNPYGVDCDLFRSSNVDRSAPVFLAVGRFVEKKGPHLTILAFAKLLENAGDAQLRMIGDGPLLGACRDLVGTLRINDKVTFLGAQSHEHVRTEMQRARAFVQHSVRASNGDSEGIPVSILEACASGLPVIATRHGGIPEIVVENKTGLLVEERDVAGMAEDMRRLSAETRLAALMGAAGRARALAEFSMDRSLQKLWTIIKTSAAERKNRGAASAGVSRS